MTWTYLDYGIDQSLLEFFGFTHYPVCSSGVAAFVVDFTVYIDIPSQNLLDKTNDLIYYNSVLK